MRRVWLLIAAALSLMLLGLGPAIADNPPGADSIFAPIPPGAGSSQAVGANSPEYRIRPLDKIDVIVFQVRELTLEKIQVDSSGQLNLPLVGRIQVAGRTTDDVQAEIADRLRNGFLRSPQVTVIVSERAPEKVTVQGAVTQAGVFEMHGRTSLAEAVAMAHGLTRTADPRHVAIVRVVNGQRQAAVFDLDEINYGRAPNPEVLGDDVVFVADSRSRVMWRNVIEALPVLSVLSYLGV